MSGTHKQHVVADSAAGPVDLGNPANSTALNGLAGAANRLPYFTGAASMALATFTSFGRSLVAAADAAAAKTLLSLTKGDVGLGNADNTSDADKPVSAQQAAADALRVLKAGDTMALTSNGGSATLIDRALIEPDGMIIGQLILTTLPSITGGSLFVHTIDLHYQSTHIGTKQKAPPFWT